MSTRIKLQRHGKKANAFFHIVVSDSRTKRSGKYIEHLGSYNPNTNPATIEIDFERSLRWIETGAEPTETVRAIFSYKGVLYRDHLLRGVKKGALTLEQADAKFNAWLESKGMAIDQKKSGLAKAKAEEERNRLAAERDVNAARAAAIAASMVVVEEITDAPTSETNTESAPAMEASVEAAEEAPTEPSVEAATESSAE